MHQNRWFSTGLITDSAFGDIRCSPRPPSRLGRGIPPPIPPECILPVNVLSGLLSMIAWQLLLAPLCQARMLQCWINTDFWRTTVVGSASRMKRREPDVGERATEHVLKVHPACSLLPFAGFLLEMFNTLHRRHSTPPTHRCSDVTELRSRYNCHCVGIARHNASSYMAKIYRVIQIKLNQLV